MSFDLLDRVLGCYVFLQLVGHHVGKPLFSCTLPKLLRSFTLVPDLLDVLLPGLLIESHASQNGYLLLVIHAEVLVLFII